MANSAGVEVGRVSITQCHETMDSLRAPDVAGPAMLLATTVTSNKARWLWVSDISSNVLLTSDPINTKNLSLPGASSCVNVYPPIILETSGSVVAYL